ncbi:hypothetical protein Q5752_007035 [Cryptotrichosporon argae]
MPLPHLTAQLHTDAHAMSGLPGRTPSPSSAPQRIVSGSLKDRIALFNNPGSAPPVPAHPFGSAGPAPAGSSHARGGLIGNRIPSLGARGADYVVVSGAGARKAESRGLIGNRIPSVGRGVLPGVGSGTGGVTPPALRASSPVGSADSSAPSGTVGSGSPSASGQSSPATSPGGLNLAALGLAPPDDSGTLTPSSTRADAGGYDGEGAGGGEGEGDAAALSTPTTPVLPPPDHDLVPGNLDLAAAALMGREASSAARSHAPSISSSLVSQYPSVEGEATLEDVSGVSTPMGTPKQQHVDLDSVGGSIRGSSTRGEGSIADDDEADSKADPEARNKADAEPENKDKADNELDKKVKGMSLEDEEDASEEQGGAVEGRKADQAAKAGDTPPAGPSDPSVAPEAAGGLPSPTTSLVGHADEGTAAASDAAAPKPVVHDAAEPAADEVAPAQIATETDAGAHTSDALERASAAAEEGSDTEPAHETKEQLLESSEADVTETASSKEPSADGKPAAKSASNKDRKLPGAFPEDPNKASDLADLKAGKLSHSEQSTPAPAPAHRDSSDVDTADPNQAADLDDLKQGKLSHAAEPMMASHPRKADANPANLMAAAAFAQNLAEEVVDPAEIKAQGGEAGTRLPEAEDPGTAAIRSDGPPPGDHVDPSGQPRVLALSPDVHFEKADGEWDSSNLAAQDARDDAAEDGTLDDEAQAKVATAEPEKESKLEQGKTVKLDMAHVQPDDTMGREKEAQEEAASDEQRHIMPEHEDQGGHDPKEGTVEGTDTTPAHAEAHEPPTPSEPEPTKPELEVKPCASTAADAAAVDAADSHRPVQVDLEHAPLAQPLLEGTVDNADALNVVPVTSEEAGERDQALETDTASTGPEAEPTFPTPPTNDLDPVEVDADTRTHTPEPEPKSELTHVHFPAVPDESKPRVEVHVSPHPTPQKAAPKTPSAPRQADEAAASSPTASPTTPGHRASTSLDVDVDTPAGATLVKRSSVRASPRSPLLDDEDPGDFAAGEGWAVIKNRIGRASEA